MDALAVARRSPPVVLLRKPQRRRSTKAAAPFDKGTRMGRQRTGEHLWGRRRTARRNGRRRRREKVGIGVGASVSRRRKRLHLGGEMRSEVESLRGRWPLQVISSGALGRGGSALGTESAPATGAGAAARVAARRARSSLRRRAPGVSRLRTRRRAVSVSGCGRGSAELDSALATSTGASVRAATRRARSALRRRSLRSQGASC